MKRRTLLQASLASLVAPSIARAAGSSVIKFIPQTDLTILDPHFTAAYATRAHALLCYDTLYGQDSSYTTSPQMAAGHVVEDDGKTWKITLRDGLKWHDGTPVLARDCAASIKRWGRRDPFGQALMAATDEVVGADDRTIRFRLKKPFPMLPDALGKLPTMLAVMMPERLASTDAFKQVTEVVGSGPFRFVANERISGARVVYEKNRDYVPRSGGVAQWTAGPKVVNVDRVEWTVIPDAATAAAAMRSGEQDWWEFPTSDLLPMLARSPGLTVAKQDPTGLMLVFRMNHVQPPFNNPAIRRALLGAMSQEDFGISVGGDDPSGWTAPVGFFTPGMPSASDVGLDVFRGKRDYDKVKRDLAAAGYKGEKVVLLIATDPSFNQQLGDVAADMLRRAGMNVETSVSDWGTFLGKRASREPVEKGGWSAFMTSLGGVDLASPAVHLFLRGNGDSAIFGWPNLPKLETLHDAWFDAPTPAAQKDIARQIQAQAMTDLPYIPAGQFLQRTAYSNRLSNVVPGYTVFWNVSKSG